MVYSIVYSISYTSFSVSPRLNDERLAGLVAHRDATHRGMSSITARDDAKRLEGLFKAPLLPAPVLHLLSPSCL